MATLRKNKITLLDYNYRRDIENRILMSQLTVHEVDLLKEVLDSSLQFTVDDLASALQIPLNEVIAALDKLSTTKLLSRQGSKVAVDKEMRKYYEFQARKFEEDFEPNIEYIQASLSKVPLHVLPTWYQLPKHTDHIFSAILDKYFQTPKIYEKYLQDLQFDDPVLNGIVKDVFSSPDFSVRSHDLREKYKLSHEQFEEMMLHLEYNFVCFISYRQVEGMWKEFVTPFFEWQEYLKFLRDTQPAAIKNSHEVESLCDREFAFVNDLSELLRFGQRIPIPVHEWKGKLTISIDYAFTHLPHLKKYDPELVQSYLTRILSKMMLLQLVEVKNYKLIPTSDIEGWLSKRPQDQALILFRNPLNRLTLFDVDQDLNTERNLREVERSLKRVLHSGWVYLEDFIKGMTAGIGSSEGIVLKQRGKRWKYHIPTYNEVEKTLVEGVICERLLEVGMTAAGTHQGRRCFCITPFGKMALGE